MPHISLDCITKDGIRRTIMRHSEDPYLFQKKKQLLLDIQKAGGIYLVHDECTPQEQNSWFRNRQRRGKRKKKKL